MIERQDEHGSAQDCVESGTGWAFSLFAAVKHDTGENNFCA